MRFPLYVTCCFFLVAFSISSLYLFFFINLTNMCLVVFLLKGTLCSLDLGDYFLSSVREGITFFNAISLIGVYCEQTSRANSQVLFQNRLPINQKLLYLQTYQICSDTLTNVTLFCLLPTSKLHRHKRILGVPMTHLFFLL